MHRAFTIASAAAALTLGNAALADFQRFDDFEAWQSAAGAITTIGFNDFPVATIITDQYADLGVHFSTDDGIGAFIVAGAGFSQDGYGLRGSDVITLEFGGSVHAFAAHFRGVSRYRFFLGDDLRFESFPEFEPAGGDGIDVFRGYLAPADMAFDRIEIDSAPVGPPPFPAVNLDNVYFSTIPAPSALALFGLGALTARRRRA